MKRPVSLETSVDHISRTLLQFQTNGPRTSQPTLSTNFSFQKWKRPHCSKITAV